MTDKWTPLTKCPHERFSNCIFVSQNEFIVAPYNYSKQKSDGILKYNTSNNKWTTLIKYPRDCTISNCTLSMDERESKLYLIGAESTVYIIDLNTHKMKKLSNGKIEVGVNAASAFIDGELHLIGGSRNKYHLIRNIYDEAQDDEKESVFDKVFEFEACGKGIQNAGLIYVRSKQEIILIGGYNQYTEHRFSDMVWVYDLSISVKDRKWVKKCKMPERCCYFGSVLSEDERYIVLIGGYTTDKKQTKKIYVLDVDTMKFIKSANISSPASGSVRASLGEDNNIYLFKHDSGQQWKIDIGSLITAYGANDDNYQYQMVKKYKKLLKESESENRQLKIQFAKQKQMNEHLATKSKKNKMDKNKKKDDDAMNKKIKKRLEELEQLVQEQSVEIQRLEEKIMKQSNYISDLETEKMRANNSNLQLRLEIKQLQQRLYALEGDAEELQSIEDFLKKQEKVAKKQEKALHEIEAEIQD